MAVDVRRALAAVARRVAWGPTPGQLETDVAGGTDATIARLTDPDGHGVPAAPDPWAGLDLTPERPGANATTAEKQQVQQERRRQSEAAIGAWLDHFVTTPRPLEDWMAWFWHGHFVSGLDKVKAPFLMVQQLRLFRSLAFARFPDLVRAATVDSAMLLYLDGDASTGRAPNENYGRELLELFTLGVGNYSEDDVKAGARALTGWAVDRATGRSHLTARGHDDSPQHYLGVDGVHDVDTVVAAVTAHAACAPFIARKLATAILGPSIDDETVRDLARTFTASGLDTRVLVRAILEVLVTRDLETVVLAPVPWLVAAQRSTGAALPTAARLAQLKAAGQLPMFPPNVAGWPSGSAWFGSSTVVARFDMAAGLAATVPDNAVALRAAASADLDALADALGRPQGFTDATRAALAQVKDRGRAVLAVALASPDLAVA